VFRNWLAGMWFAVMPAASLWSHVISYQPLSGHRSAWTQVRRDAPIVIEEAPGKNQAEALKLPYLLASRTTNYYHATPSQAKNIELVATRLNGTVVEPGQIFSYYRRVGPYTAENGFGWGRMFVGDRIVPSIGGGVCQGSSTLYSALLRTGLPIIERHHHGLTVPYLPPGEDATVASDYLDFRFKNDRATPILITASAHDRHLTVAIWGATPGPEIVVKHQILQVYPFRTITQVNHKLKPGQQEVIAPGQDGVRAKTWLEIKTPSGIKVKDLGVDQYRPSPRIIEVGPQGP
jgi:vancomycin resistance protein VanW